VLSFTFLQVRGELKLVQILIAIRTINKVLLLLICFFLLNERVNSRLFIIAQYLQVFFSKASFIWWTFFLLKLVNKHAQHLHHLVNFCLFLVIKSRTVLALFNYLLRLISNRHFAHAHVFYFLSNAAIVLRDFLHLGLKLLF
jgi:hypothetical protein